MTDPIDNPFNGPGRHVEVDFGGGPRVLQPQDSPGPDGEGVCTRCGGPWVHAILHVDPCNPCSRNPNR